MKMIQIARYLTAHQMTSYLLDVSDSGVMIKVLITQPFCDDEIHMIIMTEDRVYACGTLVKIPDCEVKPTIKFLGGGVVLIRESFMKTLGSPVDTLLLGGGIIKSHSQGGKSISEVKQKFARLTKGLSNTPEVQEKTVKPIKKSRYYSYWNDEQKFVKASTVLTRVLLEESRKLGDDATLDTLKDIIQKKHYFLRQYYVKWYIKLAGIDGYDGLVTRCLPSH
jgi:hypothetical protein